MNPPCTKCAKSVYPTEKLIAIDQPWHRGCFKCTECQLSLNLKNFQSFEQKPYCRAHLPQLKAKGSAGDSVEQQRLKAVSNMTSNIQYRADFEKNKGDAGGYGLDAPAMRQIAKNTEQQSLNKYHQVAPGGEPVSGSVPVPVPASNSAVRSVPAMGSAAPSVPNTKAPAPAAAKPDNQYRASYAYHPDADDELDFDLGDVIVDAQLVAEGWLYGTNQRTGKSGLVPEPYTVKA